MFKPISSVQICLSCFLLVTAGEKERMNQVDKKDCMQDGGWAILADFNSMTDAQVRGFRGCVFVRVCVYACGPVCIIQGTVVLPHREHSGADCLWPPAWTNIPSELLLNCHHLSFTKEWPRLLRCLAVAGLISYSLILLMKFQTHPLTHIHRSWYRRIWTYVGQCSQRRWEAWVTRRA